MKPKSSITFSISASRQQFRPQFFLTSLNLPEMDLGIKGDILSFWDFSLTLNQSGSSGHSEKENKAEG